MNQALLMMPGILNPEYTLSSWTKLLTSSSSVASSCGDAKRSTGDSDAPELLPLLPPFPSFCSRRPHQQQTKKQFIQIPTGGNESSGCSQRQILTDNQIIPIGNVKNNNNDDNKITRAGSDLDLDVA